MADWLKGSYLILVLRDYWAKRYTSRKNVSLSRLTKNYLDALTGNQKMSSKSPYFQKYIDNQISFAPDTFQDGNSIEYLYPDNYRTAGQKIEKKVHDTGNNTLKQVYI